MSASTRHQAALSAAADHYERLVASGELRCDAFRLAMETIGRNSHGRPVVAIPSELPALVDAIVRSQVSEGWREAVREVTTGRSRDRNVTDLRALVAHVLARLGYHPKAIGMVLGRDRSTIIAQDKVFAARLVVDELLAARVARLVAPTTEAKAA